MESAATFFSTLHREAKETEPCLPTVDCFPLCSVHSLHSLIFTVQTFASDKCGYKQGYAKYTNPVFPSGVCHNLGENSKAVRQTGKPGYEARHHYMVSTQEAMWLTSHPLLQSHMFPLLSLSWGSGVSEQYHPSVRVDTATGEL